MPFGESKHSHSSKRRFQLMSQDPIALAPNIRSWANSLLTWMHLLFIDSWKFLSSFTSAPKHVSVDLNMVTILSYSLSSKLSHVIWYFFFKSCLIDSSNSPLPSENFRDNLRFLPSSRTSKGTIKTLRCYPGCNYHRYTMLLTIVALWVLM